MSRPYPPDPPPINRKPPVCRWPEAPTRVDHHMCGFHLTLPSEVGVTLRRHPEYISGLFCDGCGQNAALSEFVWPGGAPIVKT